MAIADKESRKTMNDRLTSAVRQGDLEIVKELLDASGLSPWSVEGALDYDAKTAGSTSPRDETVLHLASIHDREKIVQTLLSYGADIDAKSANGETALHMSAERACANAVKTLLEHGSDINGTCNGGKTPLYRLHSTHTNILAQLFRLHVIKMQASNRHVSEINLRTIVDGGDTSHLRDDCDREIERMKREEICRNVSFHHILTEDRNKLATYARMESVRTLKADFYKRKFPIYSGWIETNLRRGRRRKDLLDRAADRLDELIHHKLPNVLTMEICRYASNDDLKNLISASGVEQVARRSSQKGDNLRGVGEEMFVQLTEIRNRKENIFLGNGSY